MAFQITTTQMTAFASVPNVAALVEAINETMARFQIDQQQRRVRYFVAQAAVECQNFTQWSENLNYTTAERLANVVWPSHFTMTPPPEVGGIVNGRAYAPDYVNNPQKLANFVYANRDGNGDVASGDGWRFRGRGVFGLTGAANYAAYSTKIYGDKRIWMNPDVVASFPDAVLSAGWFWDDNSLNAQADADAFTQTTKIINGSTSTVQARLVVLNRVNSIFTW